jgi:uncharacterized membrane protein YphA (DoxX/SURF4 family)
MKYLPVLFIIIVYMFFASGFYKLMSITETAVGFQKRMVNFDIDYFNVDIYKVIIVLAAIWEIVAPAVLVYSGTNINKYKKLGIISSLSLVIYTILATLIYHFPPTGAQYYPFISNVTTCGALLLVAYTFYSVSKL